MKRRTFWMAALSLAFPLVAGAAAPLLGRFALQGGTPHVEGYLLATQTGSNSLNRHLDTWMTRNGSATAIRSYQIDMTKYLHMIAISDDFRVFLHVHPILGHDGHFLLDQSFPSPGLYHIYVDAHPERFGQQVFRFEVNLGGPASPVARDLGETRPASEVGPYTVRISSNSLSTKNESRIVVHILKNGKPATDLHPYLGALAHAVFINAEDLSYVHAHPMQLSASNTDANGKMAMMTSPENMTMRTSLPPSAISSPNMLLHVALREPGTYKLWLQFRGGSNLYVAPFVLSAR